MEIFNTSNFWIFVSFVLFCLLAYKHLRRSVVKLLDQRINQISDELEHAERKYQEAILALDNASQELTKAKENSGKFIQDVLYECDNIKSAQLIELENQIQRKESEIQSSIKRIYDLAEIGIRHEIIDSARILVTEYLKRHAKNDPNQAQAVANIIRDLKIN